MEYIIIDQEDLNIVSPEKCGDLAAVARTVLEKIKTGRTPRVFVEVPYDVSVKVKEGSIVEAKKGKTESGKGAGGEGDRKVRRGDEGAAEEVGAGNGDNQSDSGPGD